MAVPGRIRVVEGNEALLPAVLEFARRTYPEGSHQGRIGYYHWLYERAPGKLSSMLLVLDDQDRVVGTLHRLFLDWHIHDAILQVPTLIDLALDPEYRPSGAGIRLILRGTQDVPHAFVNGSNPNSAPVFRGLRYQEIQGGVWSRLALRPLSALWRTLVFRTFGAVARPIEPQRLNPRYGIQCTSAPSDQLLADLALLANASPATVRPNWTLDSLRWRFFHPQGPRHVLFHGRDATGELLSALVLSLGTTRGLNVVRPLLLVAKDQRSMSDLIKASYRSAKDAGAHAAASYSMDATVIQVLSDLGARKRKDPPATFFHHKRRTDHLLFTDLDIPAGASDLGFDAFPRP